MRVFVAIDFDEKIKNSIWSIIEELKEYRADVKWVKKEALHVTLKFLGEVPQDRIDEINRALKKACISAGPFEISIKGTGVFPSCSRPRVLWIGIQNTDLLKMLQASVEGSFEEIGFEREKRAFHPHITIGRVRSQRGIETVLQQLRRYKDMEFGKIYVNEILLMQSILLPEGARYRKVFSIDL